MPAASQTNSIQEYIKWLLWNYPRLFGDDQYSTWRILNHLFFVLGNGYKWENGKIARLVFSGEECDLPLTEKQHNERVRDWYYNRKLRRELSKYYDNYDEYPVRFYPIYNGSLISTMPDDVEDDCLIWAARLLDFAADAPAEWFLASQEDGQPTSEKHRSDLTKFRGKFKNKWRDRLHKAGYVEK